MLSKRFKFYSLMALCLFVVEVQADDSTEAPTKSWPMFKNDVKFNGVGFGFVVSEPIKNPVRHYVKNYMVASIEERSYLAVAELDINQDGQKDTLIGEGFNKSAYMIPSWNVYLKSEESYRLLENSQILLSPSCFRIAWVESLNRKAVISCYPEKAGLGDARMVASYIDMEKKEIVNLYPVEPPDNVAKKDFFDKMFGRLGEDNSEVTFMYKSYESVRKEYSEYFEAYLQRKASRESRNADEE